MSLVLLEKHDGYAIVTLNRPAEMNALSRDLRKEFVAIFADCSADENIRVIILTGNGKAFCAGFDLKELGSDNSDNAADEVNNALAWAMSAFEGPIIGAINGHAITGGFEMALACDVLIASENARFADTHARVGILPGWGLSQKLPRLIGLSRAKEISFTGAPVFAQQAYEWGLVNHVFTAEELLPKAIEMAENMCGCVPHVLKQYKPLIDEGYSMPLNEAMPWEEAKAIESAKQASAAMIEARRKKVLEKGRSESE
ncbi:enoyl-CoA hydratase [Halieaceae bacterium IMCC14734]|uniref:Enoyl-CoA hydratase n=1 Tax=Candidatus Litorirhabdus singularis TaxID=2518993 RepID=A0ABT3TJT9_9GAMM|nr:enoyl-CoA hydratase [Candidatus Litorirhabdus singularis]MCX2982571.1 enoyl-CoA hydratase [Candidatus Litorirhabdus singularis]